MYVVIGGGAYNTYSTYNTYNNTTKKKSVPKDTL